MTTLLCRVWKISKLGWLVSMFCCEGYNTSPYGIIQLVTESLCKSMDISMYHFINVYRRNMKSPCSYEQFCCEVHGRVFLAKFRSLWAKKKSPKYSLFPLKYYFRISSINLESVITAATVRTVTLTQASRSLLLLKGWQIDKGNHLLRVYETLYWKSFSERLFLWF